MGEAENDNEGDYEDHGRTDDSALVIAVASLITSFVVNPRGAAERHQ